MLDKAGSNQARRNALAYSSEALMSTLKKFYRRVGWIMLKEKQQIESKENRNKNNRKK